MQNHTLLGENAVISPLRKFFWVVENLEDF